MVGEHWGGKELYILVHKYRVCKHSNRLRLQCEQYIEI
jgi:hypothetical protein